VQYIETMNQTESSGVESLDKIGRLTIYYDYTCGIGSIFSPNKDNYARGGELLVSFSNDTIPQPKIYDFIPPNVDGAVDLSKYDAVIGFGDSLIKQFVLGGSLRPKIRYERNIAQCLSDPVNEVNEALSKFQAWHGAQILAAANQSQSVAVITGSAVWDVVRGCVHSDLVDHIAAIRRFVTTIRTMYPNVDIYWKSPSAVVLHRFTSLNDVSKKIKLMSQYISDAIPRSLYAVQKKLMEELEVPFLDLFDAYYLSAPWSMPDDCRHYDKTVNGLLFSYYWPGLNPYA
jgi:hypothetical protein